MSARKSLLREKFMRQTYSVSGWVLLCLCVCECVCVCV